jgi:thiol-disulfide isomerase/thioredoxin
VWGRKAVMGLRNRPGAALVGAVCAVIALTGCASNASTAADAGTGYVAGDGSAIVLAEADRKPAPELSGEVLGGSSWSSPGAGEVVVANVWASWCAPCRAEAPTLEQVWQERADQGVQFVGINTRDSEAAALAFIDRYGITYPNLVDNNGAIQLAFRDTLPPQAIPSTVFIDRQGRVAARVLGEIDQVRLNGILDTLVQESL